MEENNAIIGTSVLHIDSRECEKTSLNSEDTTKPTSLSKSQLKKQKRWAKVKEQKMERRGAEKQKKKDKRKEIVSQILKQGGTKEDIDIKLRKPRFKLMSDSTNRFKIVIDMNFEEFMSEGELSKAVQQAARIYSINRHLENPSQLYITSVRDKIKDKFSITNTGYVKWDANISELDYIDLFKSTKNDSENEPNLIYLTGDSDNTLPDVEEILKNENTVFVIGGLVDHNRHKGLCLSRANERNIRTARLPISENLKLNQRHILSTVAVFEILVKIIGDRSTWHEALVSCIPKRKIADTV